ncbi:MAG: YqgE/AlgH family protein [Nitrospirae bacterium]|nr:YqgE/AlgH family protein [Candidatus Troglogloeales bacterium]
MDQKVEKGRLLIAMPMLNDPNFWQAVVLLCNYGPDGALGVVLNRPTEVAVSALIHDFPNLAGGERIYEGGPVAKNGMLVLCRGNATDGNNIVGNISLAKDLESLKESERRLRVDVAGASSEIRCYLGYAGWTPGQLEAEIKTGSWKIVRADSTLVFDADPAVLWPQMMRRLGPEWAFYATMPMNPNMN